MFRCVPPHKCTAGHEHLRRPGQLPAGTRSLPRSSALTPSACGQERRTRPACGSGAAMPCTNACHMPSACSGSSPRAPPPPVSRRNA